MIKEIEINNFKSIKKDKLSLNKLNVFIGANGAGKSNFISIFEMFNAIINSRFQRWTAENSYADNILHFGLKNSQFMRVSIRFDNNRYKIKFKPAKDGSLFFDKEDISFINKAEDEYTKQINSGKPETSLYDFQETNLDSESGYSGIPDFIIKALKEWKIFHFHDTSDTAPIKQASEIDNNRFLEKEAGNISAFLYKIKKNQPRLLKKIENYLRLILPNFDRFILQPDEIQNRMIKLKWKDLNYNKDFEAYHFSDGTLRFLSLVTLLNQPKMPEVIIIDEPELGLHPYAVSLLSDMLIKIKNNPEINTQILIATQSVELINNLSIEDVIVMENKQSKSTFKRLNKSNLEAWFEDYSLGEMWKKNLLGGRP